MSIRKEKKQADPLLPRTPVEIEGKTYDLSFDCRAMAEGRRLLRGTGSTVNLLRSVMVDDIDADTVLPLFFVALLPYQPDMTIEKAYSMVTLRTVGVIVEALLLAYARAWDPSAKFAENPPEEPKS